MAYECKSKFPNLFKKLVLTFVFKSLRHLFRHFRSLNLHSYIQRRKVLLVWVQNIKCKMLDLSSSWK
jgi:hypothetical protein